MRNFGDDPSKVSKSLKNALEEGLKTGGRWGEERV